MKNYNPFVSIIIPIYNGEKHIDTCIQSVINQSYKNIEILLMVGKCTDASIEKCIKWQKEDDRIIILSRKDNSLGDARNYGFKIAKGEFIAYIDIDDFVELNFIEELVKPLILNISIDISCCGFDKYFSNKIVQKGWIPTLSGEQDMDFDRYNAIISYGVVWNKMYRKRFLEEKGILMFDGCHEDDAMHLILSTLIKKVYFIKKVLYHYNVENIDSLFHDKDNRKDYFYAMRYAINYIKKNQLLNLHYNSLRKIIINTIVRILDETNKNNNIILECNKFLKDIFPEVMEELNFNESKDIKLESNLILFGGGSDCNRLIDKIGIENISYIIDNNINLQGSTTKGIPIISFNEFLNWKEEYLIIISSSKYYFEIAKQLRENKIYNYLDYESYYLLTLQKQSKDKTIILFNTPEHTNIGDHIIAEVEKEFFKKYLPEYGILEITDINYINYRMKIKKIVKKDDIIIITGGGFLGSLWMEGGETSVRNIIKDYPNNKIIIFPQSMYFEDNKYGNTELEISKEVYNSAKNLTVFLREEFSFELAKSIFNKNIKSFLIPDIVLSSKEYKKDKIRNSIGICLKSCKESILSAEEKNNIDDIFKKQGFTIRYTTMHSNKAIYPRLRTKYIEDKLEELSKYKLVITDALHCMILCAITKTPCIALNNISKKVEGVYKWIKHLPYIKLTNSKEDIKKIAEELLNERNDSNSYLFNYDEYSKKIISVIKE